MAERKESYTYSQDVNYVLVDRLKVMAQQAALKTRHNMKQWGFREITGSRGESCYLFEYTGKTPQIFGIVVEGLGTKNRAMDTFKTQLEFVSEAVAQQVKHLFPNPPRSDAESLMRSGLIEGELQWLNEKGRISPYFNAAVDTTMMILLDLASSGVMPAVLCAHYAVGASEWFKNESHIQDYCAGMMLVCNETGCTWGPGETAVLPNVVLPDSAVLDGAAVGVLLAKEPILGQHIKPGNLIWFVESTGLQANYLSGARRLAEQLPAKYLTRLSDGTLFGQAISMMTDIRYIRFIRRLIENEVKVNYIIPITGHGLRKIMRARQPFTYRITRLAKLSPLFRFMIEGLNLKGKAGAEEAMGGMNLGQGIAFITDSDEQTPQTSEVIMRVAREIFEKYNTVWVGGRVEEGPRQVIIEDPDPIFEIDGQIEIVFTEKDMEIRAK